jgi:signal transduction histidine kinase
LKQGRLVIAITFLIWFVSALSISAIITFLHNDTSKRTLEEVKGLARNILQSIPSGVLTTNCAGVITAENPMAEVVLKRSAGNLLGNSYTTEFHKGEIFRDVLDQALTTHEHVNQKDLSCQGEDNATRTIRVSTAELKGDDGKAAGILVQAQDVTEWLALEQCVRVADKLSALHTLSAGVAHELRNPLGAMDLNLHLFEEELKDNGACTERGTRYLQVLNTECHRLSVILDNFMKFARPESVGLHEVDIVTLIQHIVTLMQFEATEHKIRLIGETDKLLPSVVGDEMAIGQVLVNVVINAMQAMPHGGVCRIVSEVSQIEEKSWLAISVKDTGVGIDKPVLSKLFEPFYTTKPSGTGLGLAIAYRIMENHGGTIRVSSQPGTGTTVTLMFPVPIREARAV